VRLLRLVRLLRRDTPVRPATAKDAGPPFLAWPFPPERHPSGEPMG